MPGRRPHPPGSPARTDQADGAHKDRSVETLAEQRDRQVTFGQADHHPGNDPVARIRVDIGTLRPAISGGRGNISIYPVGKRLRRLPLDRGSIERVPRGDAVHGVHIDAHLKVTEIARHSFSPFSRYGWAAGVLGWGGSRFSFASPYRGLVVVKAGGGYRAIDLSYKPSPGRWLTAW
jgi:hypothetical protein